MLEISRFLSVPKYCPKGDLDDEEQICDGLRPELSCILVSVTCPKLSQKQISDNRTQGLRLERIDRLDFFVFLQF